MTLSGSDHKESNLTPQNRRTHRASIKAVEEASQDFAVDVAALRDDVENRALRCPNLFARRPPRWELDN